MNPALTFESTPPLRTIVPAITALTLLSLHLWAPTVQNGEHLPSWQLVLVLCSSTAAIALLCWVLCSRKIRLTDTTIEVSRLGTPWLVTHLPIERLQGITTLANASWGFDLTVLAFKGLQPVPVPAYYTNAGPLVRMLQAKFSDGAGAPNPSTTK